MNTPRVEAAKRLANSLQTNDDLSMWLLGHPNEENALNELLSDIEDANPERQNVG